MSRWKLFTLVVTLTLVTQGGVARPMVSFASAIPSPADSDVPSCLIACPEGEILFRVVVRDVAQNPIVGSTVMLDFSACPVFPYCGPTSGPYGIDPTNRRISRLSGVGGVADFSLALRGVCGDVTITVYASGVNLRIVPLPVMDQDGSGTVGSADIAIATAKIGTGDRSADVDCTGFVTQSDVDIIATHSGHECPLTTPTDRSSWGRLKILYR